MNPNETKSFLATSNNSENENLNCEKCDFVAKHHGALLTHINSHRECDICFKTFVGNLSARDYQRHMNSHSQPEKQFTCSKCNMSFAYKSVYDRHLRSKKCIRNHTTGT